MGTRFIQGLKYSLKPCRSYRALELDARQALNSFCLHCWTWIQTWTTTCIKIQNAGHVYRINNCFNSFVNLLVRRDECARISRLTTESSTASRSNCAQDVWWPNITGRTDGYNNFITATGAFEVLNFAVADIPSSSSTGYHGFGFDAHKSSSIYTTGGRLQPKALNSLPCIRT